NPVIEYRASDVRTSTSAGNTTTATISARLGPSQRSAERATTRGRASASAPAGRRDGVLLQLVEHPSRVAVGLHGAPDVLLDVELHLVPRGIGRRRQARVREDVEIRAQLGVRAHLRQAGLRDRQESLGGDPSGDVVGLVVEVEELLHRVLVVLL